MRVFVCLKRLIAGEITFGYVFRRIGSKVHDLWSDFKYFCWLKMHPKVILSKFLRALYSLIELMMVLLILLFVIISVSYGFSSIIRDILLSFNEEFLAKELVTYKCYYFVWFFVFCILSLFVSYLFIRYKCGLRKFYSYKYLISCMSQSYYGAPASTKDELVKRILGFDYRTNYSDISELGDIEQIIKDSYFPILAFLQKSCDEQEILFVDSPWGSGKTTNLLLAINNANTPENRYIYESAFKYSNNITEFNNDIVLALSKSLRELGLYINTRDYKELIKNMGYNPKQLFGELINSGQLDQLSIDIINKINKKYIKLDRFFCIYIIIDDLDRLKGDDVEHALALISIMRKLKFVKIIILADRSRIIEGLRLSKVIDPEIFIEKYLPSPISVKLTSGYVISEKIISVRLSKLSNIDIYRPAFAAILFKALSNKLSQTDCDGKYKKLPWLRWSDFSILQKPGISHIASVATDAPLDMADIVIDGDIRFGSRYTYQDSDSPIIEFENIITKLTDKSDNELVINSFDYDDYYYIIESWFFSYMEKNWSQFNLTIRDILDTIRSIDFYDAPRDEVEQFVHFFNMLFPNKKIQIERKHSNLSNKRLKKK